MNTNSQPNASSVATKTDILKNLRVGYVSESALEFLKLNPPTGFKPGRNPKMFRVGEIGGNGIVPPSIRRILSKLSIVGYLGGTTWELLEMVANNPDLGKSGPILAPCAGIKDEFLFISHTYGVGRCLETTSFQDLGDYRNCRSDYRWNFWILGVRL